MIATPPAKPPVAAYLTAIAEPVRDLLLTSVDIASFSGKASALTLNERRVLVEQATVLLEQNYVHLPFKVAMYGINPIRKLRLLRRRLDRLAAETDLEKAFPELEFHAELSAIFQSVHDLHTNYLLPIPYRDMIAYLPFQIEQYHDTDRQATHYIVSALVEGYNAAGFERGVEITHWNGIPIGRAVQLNAARFAGSNTAARLARGIESLTLHALSAHLPPDEEWALIGYIGLDQVPRELREKWLVVANLPPFTFDADQNRPSAAIGLDAEADELGRARRLLFAPQSIARERAARALNGPPPASGDRDIEPTTMPGVFRVRRVHTSSGTFGHIRIFTFYDIPDEDSFVAEFIRLIERLPPNGLIIDVRGNGGGYVSAGERILQTLTPSQIEPEPFQFLNSAVNLSICRSPRTKTLGIELDEWIQSMEQSFETSEVFSRPFPLTPRSAANDVGQKYHGPVVLITDARCYSATDIFAAGFQDHSIGPVLGIDENTGAGGANVWDHGLLQRLLEGASSPYEALPKGAGMRVAIRRTLRVGRCAGYPVEDLGVAPDARYLMTREDILHENPGLLNKAGELLARLPVRRLEGSVSASGSTLIIHVQFANLDRADIYVDGRPRASIDLGEATAAISIDRAPGARAVRIEGFASGELAAARTLHVTPVELSNQDGRSREDYESCVTSCLPLEDSGERRSCLKRCRRFTHA